MTERDEPLYVISVVARMLRVHPQTLRMYERQGLVKPSRRSRQRLYSQHDVRRLGLILRLTREMGVNKAGVELILRMQERMLKLQEEMLRMMQCLHEEARRDFQARLREIFSED
jgi:MerR family transcriptional regulator/heat shock protein HspR